MGMCGPKEIKNTLLNIAMRVYVSVESREIVEILLLWRVRLNFDIKYTGLYREDGGILLHKTCSRKTCRLRKELLRLFKYQELDTTSTKKTK